MTGAGVNIDGAVKFLGAWFGNSRDEGGWGGIDWTVCVGGFDSSADRKMLLYTVGGTLAVCGKASA